MAGGRDHTRRHRHGSGALTDLPTWSRVRVAASLLRGHDVLDVGAGPGLLQPFVDGAYVAVDVFPSSLPPAGSRAASSAVALAVRSASFDAVACISALQYVLDVEGALSEFHRVLRPSGQLLLVVPNVAYAASRLKLARGRFPTSSPADTWREGTVRYFSTPDFVPIVEATGFTIRQLGCSGRFHRLRRIRPQLLGADLMFDLEKS